jgi:hypothetical protein
MIDLEPMWLALAKYQPYADADGHGELWRRMCQQRTEETAVDACDGAWATEPFFWAVVGAATNAARATRAETMEIATFLIEKVIRSIERAIKEREHVPS